MEDIESWQAKFEPCQYSDKLLDKLTLLNKITDDPVDIQEVKKAIYYARKYHGSQMRKSGEPYYSHPLEVAYLFAEHVGIKNKQYYTTNLVITAILHDIMEDTDLTKDMIALIFNQSIADKVEDLTRIKFDQKITAGETVNLLFTQHKKDVLHVKLFDRLHNMRTIDSMHPEKIRKIVRETLAYFIPLASYLNTCEIRKELARLCIQGKVTQTGSILCTAEKHFSFYYQPSLLFSNPSK